jgi:WD40 repeat protein
MLTDLNSFRGVCNVKWSPDGRYLAIASRDQKVRIWEASTGKLKATLDWNSQVIGVGWNNDGTKLAIAGTFNCKILIYSIGSPPTFERQSMIRDVGYVFSVAWSNDGTKLATGGTYGQYIKIRCPSDTFDAYCLHGHSDYVRGVCFSPDGSKLASCSDDSTVRIWNLITRECVSTYEHSYW